MKASRFSHSCSTHPRSQSPFIPSTRKRSPRSKTSVKRIDLKRSENKYSIWLGKTRLTSNNREGCTDSREYISGVSHWDEIDRHSNLEQLVALPMVVSSVLDKVDNVRSRRSLVSIPSYSSHASTSHTNENTSLGSSPWVTSVRSRWDRHLERRLIVVSTSVAIARVHQSVEQSDRRDGFALERCARDRR